MKKEEIEKLIDERISNEQIDTRVIVSCIFIIFILLFICIIFYINTLRHNSDVDYHNEQLQFCKDIYYSDNVVLEQCQDYFLIVERGAVE